MFVDEYIEFVYISIFSSIYSVFYSYLASLISERWLIPSAKLAVALLKNLPSVKVENFWLNSMYYDSL